MDKNAPSRRFLSGNAYVAGSTDSPDFPGAGQTRLAGGSDAWIAKLDPEGRTEWSAYLGGTRDDYATGIALDANDDAWVAGWTESSDFPITPDAFQRSLGGGVCPAGGGSLPCADAFLAEYSPTGTLLYSTFLGGARQDEATSVAIDRRGDIGIAGFTQSGNLPLRSAYGSRLRSKHSSQICPPSTVPRAPCEDAFVSVFAPGARDLLYSTLLGGSENDQATSIAFTGQDNAVVTGWTESADFPLLHPVQRVLGGPCRIFSIGPRCPDSFVAEFTPSGSHLVYSTYLGGRAIDEATGVAVDGHGAAYVAGVTTSTNFPRVKRWTRRTTASRSCHFEVRMRLS